MSNIRPQIRIWVFRMWLTSGLRREQEGSVNGQGVCLASRTAFLINGPANIKARAPEGCAMKQVRQSQAFFV